MNTELATVVTKYKSIELTKAEAHATAFAPAMQTYHNLARGLAELNRDDPTKADAAKARELRLQLVKVRTGAEVVKDERKLLLLTESNLIQSLYNVVKDSCLLTEDEFLQIEKHEERKEYERREQLRDMRLLKLAPFEVDAKYVPLADMTEDEFSNFLRDAELLYNAKIEAEAKARREAEEREKIRQTYHLRFRALAPYAKHVTQADIDGLGEMSEQDWEEVFRKAKVTEEAEQTLRMRLNVRTQQLLEAGFTLQQDTFVAGKLAVPRVGLEILHENIFNDVLKQGREAAKRIREENERLQKEEQQRKQAEADQKAKEQAAQRAPDEEKMIILYKDIAAIHIPVLQSPEGKILASEVKGRLSDILYEIHETMLKDIL